MATSGPPNWEFFMFVSDAFAQAGGGGGGDVFMSLVPFILIFVIMYMLVIRPQQKRAKQHKEMVEAVRRGDTVVTQGGMVGKVTKVVDDGRELQIDVGQVEIRAKEGNKAAVMAPVKVRVLKQMIAEVRVKGEPAGEETASQ
jgi:preprotein translocase subunit YajC